MNFTSPQAQASGLTMPTDRYVLPSFEERTPYGYKRQDPYAKLFEDRIIFLGVQVDDASADDIIAQLIVLESQDPDRDILMYINSPGGSPAQSEYIAERIRQLAAEKGVHVLAFCEDVAASGGYWLACAADEIFVTTTSIVGSIGVISASFGAKELIGKIGLERRVALKVMHSHLSDDTVFQGRFIQEARAAARAGKESPCP